MTNEQASNGKVLPADDRRILILYGSETGNSHDFAIDLETMAERLRFRADVFGIDSITLVRGFSLRCLPCGRLFT